VSTAEKIFHKAKSLPESAQTAVLEIIEQLARHPAQEQAAPLTLRESAEMRGKLAVWEEDWNAPGIWCGFRTATSLLSNAAQRSSLKQTISIPAFRKFWFR
jgi:hypothetical protein